MRDRSFARVVVGAVRRRAVDREAVRAVAGDGAVRSKLTIWFTATAPTVDSTGPSIVGRVFHVTACSSQPQSVTKWTRPPESLPALVASTGPGRGPR